MEETVRLKPLYIVNIIAFVLALALLPFSIEWSMFFVLFIITIWSKIPGFIHFIFNKVTIDDVTTFIIALNMGSLEAIVFVLSVLWIGKLFSPGQWMPYVVRTSIAMSVFAIGAPILMQFTGSITTSFFASMVLMYAVYYALVLAFWREEVGTEIAILPAVLVFDFGMSGGIVSMFGGALSSMMTNGLGSGISIMIITGFVLGFITLSLNAKKLGSFVSNRIGGKSQKVVVVKGNKGLEIVNESTLEERRIEQKYGYRRPKESGNLEAERMIEQKYGYVGE